MNPNSGGEGQPQLKFELPPSQENGQTAEIQHDRALEKAAADDSRAGKQQPQLPAVDPATIALPAAPVDDQAQATDDSAATATTVVGSHPAKDSDIIEKVWIDKAKAIVSQTQDDPFIQKKEMSKAKADYIQKRFNKTIPTDDTVPA